MSGEKKEIIIKFPKDEWEYYATSKDYTSERQDRTKRRPRRTFLTSFARILNKKIQTLGNNF